MKQTGAVSSWECVSNNEEWIQFMCVAIHSHVLNKGLRSWPSGRPQVDLFRRLLAVIRLSVYSIDPPRGHNQILRQLHSFFMIRHLVRLATLPRRFASLEQKKGRPATRGSITSAGVDGVFEGGAGAFRRSDGGSGRDADEPRLA